MNTHVYVNTKPYWFKGEGHTKDWIICGNIFDRPILQAILGDITVKNQVVLNNKKNDSLSDLKLLGVWNIGVAISGDTVLQLEQGILLLSNRKHEL